MEGLNNYEGGQWEEEKENKLACSIVHKYCDGGYFIFNPNPMQLLFSFDTLGNRMSWHF